MIYSYIFLLPTMNQGSKSLIQPNFCTDRWMTCDFPSFSTVFQSYHDDRWMIMKAVCNGTAPYSSLCIYTNYHLKVVIITNLGQRQKSA